METFFYAHQCSLTGGCFLVFWFVFFFCLFGLGFFFCLFVGVFFIGVFGSFVLFFFVGLGGSCCFFLICCVVLESLLCLVWLGGGVFTALPTLLPSMPIREEGDFLQVLGLSFYFT